MIGIITAGLDSCQCSVFCHFCQKNFLRYEPVCLRESSLCFCFVKFATGISSISIFNRILDTYYMLKYTDSAKAGWTRSLMSFPRLGSYGAVSTGRKKT